MRRGPIAVLLLAVPPASALAGVNCMKFSAVNVVTGAPQFDVVEHVGRLDAELRRTRPI